MKTLTPFLIFCLSFPLLGAALPTHEDFSLAEGKHPGEPIENHPGWYAVPDGAALVTSEDWVSGGQSLVLLPGYPVTEAVRELPPGLDPLYVEVWMRAAFGDTLKTPGIEVEGARLHFVRQGALGTIVAGEGEDAMVTGHAFGVLERGLAARWIRVALELDREEERWSLAVDGEVVLEGVPGSREGFPGEVVFSGDTGVPVYVDALRISAEAFPEFGGDKKADREDESEADMDSSVGAGELLAQSKGEATSGDSAMGTDGYGSVSAFLNTVYVDNGAGDDTFDGRAAQAEGTGSGPVATLAAALVRVRDGGTIVIHEGVAPYTGNLGALNGKRVNLQTVGNVRVRSGGQF